MPPIESGFTPETLTALASSAGFFTRGGTDGGAFLTGVTIVAATRGGARISWGINTSQVQVDGVSGRVRGLRRRDPYTTTIATTLAQLSDADIAMLLGVAATGTDPKVFKPASVDTFATAGQSITDLRFWIKRSDTKWVAIYFPSAYPVIGEVSTADRTDIGIPVTFEAESIPDTAFSNLDEPPFTVEVWTGAPQVA